MRRLFALLTLLGASIAFGQNAGPAPTPGQVPDESVLPQWKATFPILFEARQTLGLIGSAPAHVSPSSE
jgi:hypothetical protein